MSSDKEKEKEIGGQGVMPAGDIPPVIENNRKLKDYLC